MSSLPHRSSAMPHALRPAAATVSRGHAAAVLRDGVVLPGGLPLPLQALLLRAAHI